MNWYELIEQFIDDQPDWTDRTCAWYRRCLVDLINFLRTERNITDPADIEPPDINAYLGRLRRNKLAYNTRNGAYTIIQAWFRWLRLRRKIPNNPFADPESGLKRPRKIRKRVRPATVKQMQQMITAARCCESDIACRDLAIMILLATTGLRRAEIVKLTLTDIDFDEEEIYLTGKGEHERKVVLLPVATQALRAWLDIRPDAREPVIFISLHGSKKGRHHALLPDTVNDRLIYWRDLAGLPRISVSPHKWRHAFASHISRAGNVFALQELLGHADIATTQIYVHTPDEELRRLVEAYGPELE
ncbi:MAG: tyrosine-type recombinase/integrase [Chloroflexota bacterium]